MEIKFTDNQKSFIECPERNIFLNACPGAGKTKSVVARFIERAKTLSSNYGRKSIAVLSFTNVAVKEITDRCFKNNLSHLLNYPNYIGTFDSFLNRYIFRQFMNSPLPHPITIVESWDAVGATVSCQHGNIPLSVFIFTNDSVVLKRTNDFRINTSHRKDPDLWAYHAKKIRDMFFSYGIISTEEVRNYLFSEIAKDDKIFNSLSKRFDEIIVDEIQDCNEQDLLILEKARDYGSNVVMVGDLDQSIYRFRNVDLTKIETFISSHKPISLFENFRSTNIICELYSTLKKENKKDVSEAEHAGLDIPISLIFYSTLNKEVGDKFLNSLNSLSERMENYRIISYQEDVARKVTGEKNKEVGSSCCERLASSINLFRNDNSTPKQKKLAMITVEYLLLRLLNQDITHYSTESYCKKNDINYRWLKRCSLQVLHSVPTPPKRKNSVDDWITEVKEQLSKLPNPDDSSLNWKAPGIVLRKPKHWSINDFTNRNKIASTIHGVKGEEYDAVLVIIDNDDRSDRLFDNWINRRIGESERVMYVACSRAKKYLSIAVPEKNRGIIIDFFDEKDIRYRVIS